MDTQTQVNDHKLDPKAAAAKAAEPPLMRRFELPDIDRHGVWLFERLKAIYPHLNDRSINGWLRSVLYSNEFKFLYQDNAVGLMQVVGAHTLAPVPIIEERFVFCRERENLNHIQEAAYFYADFRNWAKHHGAQVMTVGEFSDVPPDLIKERLDGVRLFNKETKFIRL